MYPITKDVESIDGIINAFYEVVSGPKGAPRQWERDRSIHHEKALVVFTGVRDQNPYFEAMTLQEFHAIESPYTEGFFEKEIERRVQKFGNIAQVWSKYETRFSPTGPVERSGINSIQLVNDGQRWWILSWMFDGLRNQNEDEFDS